MTTRPRIVILHPAGGLPADLPVLARALEAEGTEVTLVECAAPYDSALDAVEHADRVVFWR